jgi:hypothetical protein
MVWIKTPSSNSNLKKLGNPAPNAERTMPPENL